MRPWRSGLLPDHRQLLDVHPLCLWNERENELMNEWPVTVLEHTMTDQGEHLLVFFKIHFPLHPPSNPSYVPPSQIDSFKRQPVRMSSL